MLADACHLEQLEGQWLGLDMTSCHSIQIIWVDKTFIKIQGQTWYLTVAVDKVGGVVHHRLLDNRSEKALRVFWDELTQKCPHIQLLVTDGLPGYEKMCKSQKKRVFHIQHIHKNDRRQVRVTQYDYDSIKGIHLMKQVGLVNNALLTCESTIVHYIEKEEKDKTIKRPQGRPKGQKDTKPRKKRASSSRSSPPDADKASVLVKKRGRKNVFRDGSPHVLDSFATNRGIAVTFLGDSLNN
ncbi:MAG: DDE-type integrase/transposase/recombinase [Candidatus Hermodarchaeota archaeon]